MALITTERSVNLSPNLRILLVPVAGVIVLVMLSFFVMREMVNRISLTRLKVNRSLKDVKVLQQKQIFLQEVTDQTQVQSEAATLALPERNPALLAMAQLRNLAERHFVSLENVAAGGEEKSGGEVATVVISFDAIGRLDRVLDFLASIQKSAPLARLDNVKIAQQSQETSIVTANLKAFWAPFPQQIPAITEPVKQLTQEEEEVLSQLMQLMLPPFFAAGQLPTTPSLPGAQPQVPSIRTNPFTF